MGLDMYLERHTHVSNYEFDPNGQRIARAVMNALGIKDQAMYANSTLTVSLLVAYWRKANAIHGWFVKNVQGGVDDCGSYYVAVGQLKELRDLCSDVLAGRRPKDDLPPVDGFFFGNTEDDEWYRSDLEETVQKLDKVLSSPRSHLDSFYYQSSW